MRAINWVPIILVFIQCCDEPSCPETNPISLKKIASLKYYYNDRHLLNEYHFQYAEDVITSVNLVNYEREELSGTYAKVSEYVYKYSGGQLNEIANIVDPEDKRVVYDSSGSLTISGANGYSTYTYDATRKLISSFRRSRDADQGSDSKSSFTYRCDNVEKVSSEGTTWRFGPPTQHYSTDNTVFYYYQHQLNPFNDKKYFEFTLAAYGFGHFSKNLIEKQTVTPGFLEYTYEFDKDDFPIKITGTMNDGTNQYVVTTEEIEY